MPASRERNLVIKSDFQCPLLRRIPVLKVIKRDDLFYQFLHDHKLDELGATDQALVILAAVKFCNIIDGHIRGKRIDEVAKDEKDFVGMAAALRPKGKPEQQSEDQFAVWEKALSD